MTILGAVVPLRKGKQLNAADVRRAAASLGCEPAAVRAVIEVESKGGFLPDGRPKILFERHYFSRFTGGRFDSRHPEISSKRPGGYRDSGAGEYERLSLAAKLDGQAALKSASWGLFQIMGANHALCGYDSVEAFVAAMFRSEGDQLNAFVAFVQANGLAEELRNRDWKGFARGYNGPMYARNKYDTKLAESYGRYAAQERSAAVIGASGAEEQGRSAPIGEDQAFLAVENARKIAADEIAKSTALAREKLEQLRRAHRPTLREGSRGESVVQLQQLLGVRPDGVFGPTTGRAVRNAQAANDLSVDGIVGPQTWSKLLGGKAEAAAAAPAIEPVETPSEVAAAKPLRKRLGLKFGI